MDPMAIPVIPRMIDRMISSKSILQLNKEKKHVQDILKMVRPYIINRDHAT